MWGRREGGSGGTEGARDEEELREEEAKVALPAEPERRRWPLPPSPHAGEGCMRDA